MEARSDTNDIVPAPLGAEGGVSSLPAVAEAGKPAAAALARMEQA